MSDTFKKIFTPGRKLKLSLIFGWGIILGCWWGIENHFIPDYSWAISIVLLTLRYSPGLIGYFFEVVSEMCSNFFDNAAYTELDRVTVGDSGGVAQALNFVFAVLGIIFFAIIFLAISGIGVFIYLLMETYFFIKYLFLDIREKKKRRELESHNKINYKESRSEYYV